jgi:alcohol dehydrogenase class IV
MAKLRFAFPAFQMPPVSSGSGSLKSLAQLPELDGAAFLLSGQASVASRLEAALAKAGLTPPPDRVLRKPSGEPSIESILVGSAFLRQRAWSAIVAIGGGSVLDWARLSWAHAAGLLDLESGQIQSARGIARPVIVLAPTTCASGAEGASVAVYSNRARKQAVVSPAFLADRVILDGHVLASLDEATLSASLSDAHSHAIESLFSLVPNGLAKMTAGAALRTLLAFAPGGVPTASRADRLLEASYLAGAAASHTSVGIAHAFAHAMAAEDVPHGAGNALALAAAVRFNAATSAMEGVLAAAGLSQAELLAKLRAVSGPARRAAASVTIATLNDIERRTALTGRMLEDVAIRTNPVVVNAAEAAAFLDLVREETAQP